MSSRRLSKDTRLTALTGFSAALSPLAQEFISKILALMPNREQDIAILDTRCADMIKADNAWTKARRKYKEALKARNDLHAEVLVLIGSVRGRAEHIVRNFEGGAVVQAVVDSCPAPSTIKRAKVASVVTSLVDGVGEYSALFARADVGEATLASMTDKSAELTKAIAATASAKATRSSSRATYNQALEALLAQIYVVEDSMWNADSEELHAALQSLRNDYLPLIAKAAAKGGG